MDLSQLSSALPAHGEPPSEPSSSTHEIESNYDSAEHDLHDRRGDTAVDENGSSVPAATSSSGILPPLRLPAASSSDWRSRSREPGREGYGFRPTSGANTPNVGQSPANKHPHAQAALDGLSARSNSVADQNGLGWPGKRTSPVRI